MGTELGIIHPVSGTSEERDQMYMNLRTVVTKKGVMVMMSCTWKSSSSPTAHKECQKENAKGDPESRSSIVHKQEKREGRSRYSIHVFVFSLSSITRRRHVTSP